MTTEELLRQAIQIHSAGDLARAETIYRQAILKDPKFADAWHLYGVLRHQAGDSAAALEMIDKAISYKPITQDYYYNKGLVLLALSRREDASASFHRAAMLPASTPEVQIRLAKALCQTRQWDDAMSCLGRMLKSRPNDPETMQVQAKAMLDMGKFRPAMELFKKIGEIAPDDEWSRWACAVLLLLHGDFADGWTQFERRLDLPNGPADKTISQPKWIGGELPGKTLLVHSEGGFGDSIHYVRFVPMIRDRAGSTVRIVLECQKELVPLFASVPGVDQLIAKGDERPPINAHIPLPSLAWIFKTDLMNVPSAVPYLKVPEDRKAAWSAKVEKTGKRNIGLCWRGNKASPQEGTRDVAPADLAPLAEIPGIRWFSLQVEPESARQAPPGMELTELLNGDIHDFADTAALVEQLDLVITVDTSVAHLAGALARPVWTFIPFVPDYRWLLEREDSIWYPTMRLFRQEKLDDWQAPMARMVESLLRSS